MKIETLLQILTNNQITHSDICFIIKDNNEYKKYTSIKEASAHIDDDGKKIIILELDK